MRAVGIVRKLNDNGRVVIPMELRKLYGIDSDDASVELFANDEGIFIKKYEPACIFCGSVSDVEVVGNKKICKICMDKIKQS